MSRRFNTIGWSVIIIDFVGLPPIGTAYSVLRTEPLLPERQLSCQVVYSISLEVLI